MEFARYDSHDLSACLLRIERRLDQMMVVGQNLAQALQLLRLRFGLLNGQPLLVANAKDDGVLGQRTLIGQFAAGPDQTAIGDAHASRDVTLALEHVALSDHGRFHRAAHLEHIAGADQQRWRRLHGISAVVAGAVGLLLLGDAHIVDDGGVLLEQTVLADDDGTGHGQNGDARMDDTAVGDGDVAAEDALLAVADDGFRPDFQSAGGRERRARWYKKTALRLVGILRDMRYLLGALLEFVHVKIVARDSR